MRSSKTPEVSYYMVCINDLETVDECLSAEEILNVLTRAGVWQLGESAANRARISPGDRLVFYMAGHRRCYLAGTATVASPPEPILKGQRLPFMELSFAIRDVDIWEEPTPIRPLLRKLSFVEERLIPYWGLYFRGGTRKLSPRDFRTMTAKSRRG